MPSEPRDEHDALPDFDTLALLHLDGLLEAEGHAAFCRQVAADPRLAARLADLAELHAGLIELGRTTHSQARAARSSGTQARVSRRLRRASMHVAGRRVSPWGLATAALLVLGVVIGLLVPRTARARDVLTVDHGSVVLERHGARTLVNGSLALLPGDQVHAAGNARAHIDSMLGDRLALSGGSRLAWSTATSAVRLETGSLIAEITPRPPGLPFILATPRADLLVLGTRFTVQADEALSLLAVDHGRVRLANRDDRRQVEVAAQQLVVTTGTGELTPTRGGVAAATGGTGLTGDYFAQQDFTAWCYRRVDPAIDFDWGMRGPGARMPAQRFSVRWRGWLVPTHSGPCTFTFLMDDGVRLWLDGRLVFDEWHLSEKLEFSSSVTLEAGRAYQLRLDFYQEPTDAVIRWSWAAAGQPKQLVPTSWLRPLEWSPTTP